MATTLAPRRVSKRSNNRLRPTSSAIDRRVGYPGKLFDDKTGLQNNLNRWYEPATGKWLSVDPIGFEAGDTSMYRYVGNNPLHHTDPHGKYSVTSVDIPFGCFPMPGVMYVGHCTCRFATGALVAAVLAMQAEFAAEVNCSTCWFMGQCKGDPLTGELYFANRCMSKLLSAKTGGVCTCGP
jgi:RHS repeat-associated protein